MIARFLLFLIRIYWWTLSPLIGQVCRFQPSCSRYTAACIQRFGAARGSWLGAVRICKCHPLHPGGFDPPPDTFQWFPRATKHDIDDGPQARRSNFVCRPSSTDEGVMHG